MLSRKHYKAIASIIKDNSYSRCKRCEDNIDVILKDDLINELCVEFKRDNNLFNKQTFIDACNFGCDDGCDFE